ncbi:MAG: hypothetical protein KDA58_10755 [Planctomycetaceae bacterium]|nr:hypothetical protein [Planctomycetaceae bacterium]
MLGCLGLMTTSVIAAETGSLIATITQVGARGEGHAAATAAVRELETSAQAADLVPLLKAMNSAAPLPANWLRGAFEAAADRALSANSLPTADLDAFVRDRSNTPRVRRLAYEWLLKGDPEAETRFLPTLLDDPSAEMRRDAVARLIGQAREQTGDEALKLWRQALSGAVDEDQVDAIAKALKELDVPFNRVQHFGLLVDWHVIGPFDNVDQKGFPVAYPPEEQVDLNAEYTGKLGPVTWQQLHSDEADGAFDIAKLTEPHKGAIDYLYTEFKAGEELPVEFRLATANAWKLWVNGELVFAREEYHRGMRFDQYIVPGKLQAGKNTILLKVCQNEQDQDWAQRWAVQFRVCDVTGKAVHQMP